MSRRMVYLPCRRRTNGIDKVFPNLETPKHVHVELAKKAGIGKSNMANLLAVYRNRLDLYADEGGKVPRKAEKIRYIK